jgi:hypothetical protein
LFRNSLSFPTILIRAFHFFVAQRNLAKYRRNGSDGIQGMNHVSVLCGRASQAGDLFPLVIMIADRSSKSYRKFFFDEVQASIDCVTDTHFDGEPIAVVAERGQFGTVIPMSAIVGSFQFAHPHETESFRHDDVIGRCGCVSNAF